MNKLLVEKLGKTEEVEPPIWAKFVKTGRNKERTPTSENWWCIRAASLLSKVEKFGPIGVNRLSKQYGGRKNRGVRPEKKFGGSRNIVRKCLQQLEQADFIKKSEHIKKGRVLTRKGKELLKSCD